jgi:hypothetical protein
MDGSSSATEYFDCTADNNFTAKMSTTIDPSSVTLRKFRWNLVNSTGMNIAGNDDDYTDDAAVLLLSQRQYEERGDGIKKAIYFDFKCLMSGEAVLNLIFGND